MLTMKRGSIMLLVITTVVLFLTGCFSSVAKKALPDITLPQEKQVKNITQYDDVLYCMDNLYEILQERQHGLGDDALTSVYVRPIINQTANKKALPEEIKIMLITALNKLGNHIRILSEEPVEDENYYILEAAVTEFDAISSQNANFNAGVSFGKGNGRTDMDGQGGYKKKVANMAIDFNIIDAQKKIYEPYVSTSYKMKITKLADSNDYAIYIGNQGIGLYANATKQQGIMSAVRLLIEVSLAELFGEHDILPYWKCTGTKIDRQMRSVIRHFYNKAKLNDNLNSYAVYYLRLWGLLGEDAPDQAQLDEAIVKFKKMHHLPPYNAEITEDFFSALLTKVPPRNANRGGTNIDLFEKYSNVAQIKVYKDALSRVVETEKETWNEQNKKIDSLVYLFQKYKKKYPNAKILIKSYIDNNKSLQVAQENIDIIYNILRSNGIDRTEIITQGIKTDRGCTEGDRKCEFENTYYTFSFKN